MNARSAIQRAEQPEPGGALRLVRSALPQALRARVQSAREMARGHEEAAREPLATGVPALDRPLGGGLPRGELVEMAGGRSSGRFSVALAALAAVTAAGEAAALVDLGDSLDPAHAAALGADLERLLWLRPGRIKQALAGAEMLIGSGFPLVVVDLGNPPLPGGRGAEGFWLRLARAAADQGAALLVSSPYRVTGTAAGAVLAARRGQASWLGGGRSPWLLDRLAGALVLEKRRGAAPGQAEPLELSASPLPSTREPARPARPSVLPAEVAGWELDLPVAVAASG